MLEEEIANGKCEQCQPLAPVSEESEAEAPVEAPAAAPAQMSLLPPEPFDETAALKDIFAKNRAVEACRKTYEELKQRASDAKKSWEAAATLTEQATATYEVKYRAWVEAEERQRELVDAYEQAATAPVESGEIPHDAPAEAPAEAAPAA